MGSPAANGEGAKHSQALGSSYRGDTESAFSEEEVRYLAESFQQRAFQQATAQEQVVFALARPSDLGLEQVTSGVWFVEDGPNPSAPGHLPGRRDHGRLETDLAGSPCSRKPGRFTNWCRVKARRC